MSVRGSLRLESLGGYAFAEVDRIVEDLRRQGASVLDFGVGDPKAPTPEIARERAKRALDEHATTGYPSYIGSQGFRAACADWIGRRFGVKVDPAKHVSATIGSKEAVFHLPLAFVDPGDVVISPNPGYPPYTRGTMFAGGRNWTYPLRASQGFLPDLGAIPADVLRETRVLWICSPNSPTGSVAPLDFLRDAAKFCRKHGILLASDEAYSELWFGDEPPHSALETGLENVLSVFSMSKRSNMTGWRVGFVAGDEEAVRLFRKLKTNIDSGTPNALQDGSVAALSDETHVAAMRREYRAKRDLLCGAFRKLGLPDCTPEATIYVWQKGPAGMSSVEFAKRLLDPAVAVVTTPGTWLSSPDGGEDPGEGYVRLALVPTPEECADAARRLAGLRF
ncbi:MAG: LL-diaminopimelate aminotransferase [Planctomycetes bacterium]|nr:LL-diaminopimelate aminotransferase [Planctomycetota bacterium]